MNEPNGSSTVFHCNRLVDEEIYEKGVEFDEQFIYQLNVAHTNVQNKIDKQHPIIWLGTGSF